LPQKLINQMKFKSWEDLKNHPDIESIEDMRKEFKNSMYQDILINIKEESENPVTGELGGCFYASSFRDAVDLLN